MTRPLEENIQGGAASCLSARGFPHRHAAWLRSAMDSMRTAATTPGSLTVVAGGLAVYAVDLRGRGKSEGERFFVENIRDYVDDVHALI